MATLSGGGATQGVVLLEANLSRATQAVVHEIVGRSTPMVTAGVLGSRSGTLVFEARSYAEATGLITQLHGVTKTLTAPEHPGLSGMNFYATDFSIDQWERLSGGWAWRLTVDVVEVD